jgi:hypothetical protein
VRVLEQLLGPGVENLVGQHKTRFVLDAEVAGHREHRLALNFVTEDRDCKQVNFEGHLVEREQRAARDREILAAGFAAPAGRAIRTTAGIDDRATAVRAIGVAVVVCPAEPDEYPLGFLIAHPRDRR